MKILFGYLIASLLLAWITWIFFCCVMRLQQVKDAGQLKGKMLCAFAYPTLFVGLFLDTLVNWLVMTVVFLEFPQECLTTSRLCRLYEPESNDWRSRLAAWLGNVFLNPIDPSGRHVK